MLILLLVKKGKLILNMFNHQISVILEYIVLDAVFGR